MSSLKSRKIFFLHPYPKGKAPGQRFRYEQYQDALVQNGFELQFHSFLDGSTSEILYQEGHTLRKVFGVIRGFIRRFTLLFPLRKASYVFIFREAAPFGPPIFEWFIARILRKPIIYDFDDAIWTTDKQEGALESWLRWRSKVATNCRWAATVSCGNEYLATFAREYNTNVVLNPTTIDTDRAVDPNQKRKNPHQFTIGWTGSHSTIKYLHRIVPVINILEKKYPSLRFLVVADRKPALAVDCLSFRAWTEKNEIADLLEFDVGIMPLPDDEWARGKCGFKALQYMSLGIATVASPVGVNKKIIEHGRNGFLASDDQGWITSLDKLIHSAELRKSLGEAGVQTVLKDYSVRSNTPNFLRMFH
jgi:glycosyltransferase involved in cell wall biosynthesis